MGMIVLCIAAWLGGIFLAYCFVAVNPRDDD
jgi:hypothetical protein